MTIDQWITLGIILVAVILFVSEWLSVDVVALLIISLLLVTGVLGPAEAVKGFSNSATITIMAMFALSAALLKTGELNNVGRYLSKILVTNKIIGIVMIMVITGAISAFINNTPVVAIFIPIILAACRKANLSASKVLIPLSFASMLGGVCTLIGTSTNILISSIAEDSGIEGFGMFEISKLGVIFFIVGTVYLLLFGIRLIPERGNVTDLTQKFELGNYLTDIRLLSSAPSVGKSISESPLRKEEDIEIIGFKRENEMFSEPIPSQILQEGDILRISGNVDQIKKIQAREGVEILQGEWKDRDLNTEEVRLSEAIITPNSELHNKSISQSRFKYRYNATVLAIRGRGGIYHDKLSRLILKSGDVILLRVRKDYINDYKSSTDTSAKPFLIISETEGHKNVEIRNMLTVFGVLVLVIGLAALEIMPIMASSLVGVTLLLIFRSITIREVYAAINWQIIFLLAGTISLGLAMEKTGLANLMAEKLIGFFGDWGPIVILSVLYLVTSLLTEVMSNSASAVLLTPIAISAAQSLHVDPRPFLFAIAFAASASFLTPVGYQTNTMIYSAGNYKFTDFFKVGLPLNIILWIVATLLIPVFYKF